MTSHKDLIVWQKAMSFVEGIYALTRCFPDEEKYGLISQLKRASVSIPSNISEGAARQGKKEFEYFLYMALGSASEVETQLELAGRLGFAPESLIAFHQEKITEIRRMLQGTIRHLRSVTSNK